MRPVLWIAADMLRDAITRPAPTVAALATIVLIPLQTGIVDGVLWNVGAGMEHGVHLLLTTSALCPALSALILFSTVMFRRLITGELEPLLSAPVTDRVIAFGCVLPFLAVATAGSIPASVLTLLGVAIPTGTVSPGALDDCLEIFLSSQLSTFCVGTALIRSIRRLASQASPCGTSSWPFSRWQRWMWCRSS